MNIKTFVMDPKLKYEERHVRNTYVNKFYELEQIGMKIPFYTIPDACVDIQFIKKNGVLTVNACGSYLQNEKSPSSDHNWCFGVKFNPGKYPMFIQEYIEELIGNRQDISDVKWIAELGKKIETAESFEERIYIFEMEFPYNEQFAKKNDMVETIIQMIDESSGTISISEIAEKVRYNQRYMDRVFHKATGLSMKKYAMIIQIQTAIDYLMQDREDEIYEKLGYYDQSYFIKLFKKFTSMTPKNFSRKLGNHIV